MVELSKLYGKTGENSEIYKDIMENSMRYSALGFESKQY